MATIGRYELLEELGRGAMGAVYKARDPQIGRTVAIKRILTAGLAAEELAQYKQRFYREARIAGQLSHPGVVTIHDIAEDADGQPYLVMEFVDGVTLHRMLRPAHTGHLPELIPVDQALDLGAQIAEALDYAHRRGVVHRDIKPGNILVTAEGRAKIADFGIAKFTDAEATRTTSVMGTPAYMAPEQLRGGLVDARSDLFSLGAMLYWILTGQKPFPGDDLTSVSFKVVYTDPDPPSTIDHQLPRDLDIVMSRCLAKNPGDRYPSAKELAVDLQAIREGKPISTTAAPRDSGAEPTVSTMPGIGARPAAPPAAVAAARPKAAPQPSSRMPRVGVLVAALLALAATVVVLVWNLQSEQVKYVHIGGTQPAAPSPATKAKSPAAARPAPVGKPAHAAEPAQVQPSDSAASAPAEAPPPAGTATLAVECRHNFKQARLEVFLGERSIVNEELAGKANFWGNVGGRLEAAGPVAAGTYDVRVRVVSTDRQDPFDEEAAIEGEFSADTTRRLRIEFGKGSGIGMGKRKLTLRWADKK
jgi:serine/threonine-protein kinase